MTAPPVTVVTATWQRWASLKRAIASLQAQDYAGRIQHLVVIDGQAEDTLGLLRGLGYGSAGDQMVVSLGRNWSADEVVHGGVGVIPRQVGAWLATGDYVAYLDDDNEYLPHHVSTLVAVLERSGTDFACSQWHMGTSGHVHGWAPPGRGRTDTSSIMHRPGVLAHATWNPEVGYENDGALVEAWIAAGATWTFVAEPTFVLHGHRRGAPDPEVAHASA